MILCREVDPPGRIPVNGQGSARGAAMKRKVAAFGNGWSDEYLMVAIEGIQRCAQENDIDVYVFLEYASYNKEDENVQGELNLLRLPNLSDYDGILLLGNTLNNAGELDTLCEQIRKIDVPAVCLEYQVEGIDSICTDNYQGMRELCDHLIEEHDVKRVVWVSGLPGNTENEERYRALVESLQAHGLSHDEKDIIPGEWSYYAVQVKVEDWLDDNLHALPDAFVCANDVMAMGVMARLMQRGIKIPQDVKVTGFDNIKSSRTFFPALSTVDRSWDQRGYDGLKHLVDLMNGEPKAGIKIFPSRAMIRESCSCDITPEMKREQIETINQVYTIPIERTFFDWHLSGMDDAVNNCITLEAIHDGLKTFFGEGKSKYEGATFCICLDESFVASIYEESEPSCLGYSEQMHVLYAKRDGKHLPYQKIKTSYIFPVFSDPSEKGNIYIIAPLHMLSANMGYCVFKNYIEILDTYFLYSWMRHLRAGLIRCRQNIIMGNMYQRLRDYSVLDELTGLLNRKGYERKGIPMLEELREQKKRALMMVVDINKMKTINDRYGHLQGDLAIRSVAKAIKEKIPENWYGIRYGGDEFVVIGENVFIDDGDIMKRQLCAAVEHERVVLQLPFELSISVGSVSIDPSENISLDEYFRRADDAMYEMKKINHAERRD